MGSAEMHVILENYKHISIKASSRAQDKNRKEPIASHMPYILWGLTDMNNCCWQSKSAFKIVPEIVPGHLSVTKAFIHCSTSRLGKWSNSMRHDCIDSKYTLVSNLQASHQETDDRIMENIHRVSSKDNYSSNIRH